MLRFVMKRVNGNAVELNCGHQTPPMEDWAFCNTCWREFVRRNTFDEEDFKSPLMEAYIPTR